ncbi:S26 family signal peptidase [Nocardioides sp. B-3]|uniref:S26 family signal peptidase n=1 Tax=Nocardioides sp. B-3 TaxID=2895565 RepID=UPI003FA5BC61
MMQNVVHLTKLPQRQPESTMVWARSTHPRRVIMRFHDERGSAILRGLGWVLTAVVLSALLVIAAAFTSSVVVQGDSMEPTVTTGDRIVVNPFGGHYGALRHR